MKNARYFEPQTKSVKDRFPTQNFEEGVLRCYIINFQVTKKKKIKMIIITPDQLRVQEKLR